MERNIFDTLDAAIENIVDDDYVGPQDVVLLPPSNDPYASDEEEGDDDIGLAGNLNLPSDFTGTIEIHRKADEDDVPANDQSKTKEKKRKWRHGIKLFDVNWYKNDEISNVVGAFGDLVNKTELELYKLFFDEEVEQLFIEQTKKYAATQINYTNFKMDRTNLWDFLTIMTFSAYNTRPQFCHYWSNDADLASSFVRDLMSRNQFRKIKSYLHVCDNEDLELNDKWAKLPPLIDIVNNNLIQFGAFAEHLSIDQQMVPYFGRHSCKMFIRGKPIRFGYKNWVICSNDGYPFKVIPYQGKLNGNKEGPLGPRVVKQLLEIVTDANKHDVYFGNFFISLPLLEELKQMSLSATGTIRLNRVPGLPSPTNNEMAKEECGFMSVSSTNDICLVRWVDNKVVMVASNYLTHEPNKNCKRCSRAKKAPIDVAQPNLIRQYNCYMVGVDQLDGYLNNLRPCIAGKKWYWVQMINMIRIPQVAAYRFYCQLHPEKRVSQLDFICSLVHQYVRFDRVAANKNVSIPNEEG